MVNEQPKVSYLGSYTITQACKHLGCSKNTIKKYEALGMIQVRAKQLPSGRLVRIYKGKEILRLWNLLS